MESRDSECNPDLHRIRQSGFVSSARIVDVTALLIVDVTALWGRDPIGLLGSRPPVNIA